MKILPLFAMALVAACSDDRDSPIGPATHELSIVSEASALPVGRSMLLQAELRSTGKRTRTVQPRWTISDAAIGVIGHDGALRGVAIGRVTVIAEYETLQTSAMFAIVADVSGTWAGEATVSDCRRLSGPGTDPCRFLRGVVHQTELTVAQSGDHASGRMRLHREVRGTFEGRVTEDVVVVKANLTSEEDQGVFKIEEWTLRRTASELVTTGPLRIDRESTNVFGRQHMTLTYSVSPFRRTSS